MQAYELIIDSKVKLAPFDIVSVNDFLFHTGQSLDPYTILEQPNISLYCLDHVEQRAIFVETSPGVDLLHAPFYFIAQYEAARRLIAVPYETLHALVGKIEVDPQRIILFYSTGRCGSTLFSQVLNLNPSVTSFSEPDVFSQLVILRTMGQSSEQEIASLLWDSVMVMSANAKQQGFQSFAFKFRSYVLSVSDLLYRILPQAKILFMYRNALTWAYSFTRAFGAPNDAALNERLLKYGIRYLIPAVNDYLKTHAGISWVEYIARMWVSTMRDANWLQQQGAPLAGARFEELKATPQAVIESLLTHCGLAMPDPTGLAAVLAKDSQEGTEGAQNKQEPARRLTDAELAELNRVITGLDPNLAPDTLLAMPK